MFTPILILFLPLSEISQSPKKNGNPTMITVLESGMMTVAISSNSYGMGTTMAIC
jgi:hypothetical protein